MKFNENIQQSKVLWILIAQCSVFVPHIPHVPLWLTGIFIACIAWSYAVVFRRWSYPPSWIKLLFIAVAFVGVIATYHTIAGARGGVALLLLAFSFKSLELRERRDAYTLIFLSYFVLACAFLFERSLWTAFYLLFCTSFVTTALLNLNTIQPDSTVNSGFPALDFSGFRFSAKIILQSLPLMVLLFIFFPKIPPLFQLDLGGSDAKSGLSDRLSPGSISNLMQSGELAFRVTFKDDIPEQSALYWRAQVFEHFDGITWTMSKKTKMSDERKEIIKQDLTGIESIDSKPLEENAIFEYEILQEPSYQKLLFSLASPWSNDSQIQLNTDFTLSKKDNVDKLYLYTAWSNLNYVKNKTLSDNSRYYNLLLPKQGNERARELAQKLKKKTQTNLDFLNVVREYFLSKPYQYTLRPPKLGPNPVDEFIFDTLKGFCGHYASSFVYLMRAGGVPARLVGGYQGGEYNESGNYFLVHQFDAHAWAEVWLEDQGWSRVDPTSWIAPNRIDQGIQESLPQGESILDSTLFSTRKSGALTKLRLQLDFINLQWNQWVLSYNAEKQKTLIRKLLGAASPTRIAIFMSVSFSLIIALTLLTIYLQDIFRIKDPADRLYFSVLRRLGRKHIEKHSYETPNEFAARVAKIRPNEFKDFLEFSELYTRLKFHKPLSKGDQKLLLNAFKILAKRI